MSNKKKREKGLLRTERLTCALSLETARKQCWSALILHRREDCLGSAREPGLPIDDNENRWTGTAQADAEDSGTSSQRKQTWQKRTHLGAIGLVNPILHRNAQQISAPLCKREAEHGDGLDVRNHICAGVGCGKHSSGLAGRQ
jgi:hypothetical protein